MLQSAHNLDCTHAGTITGRLRHSSMAQRNCLDSTKCMMRVCFVCMVTMDGLPGKQECMDIHRKLCGIKSLREATPKER